MSLDILLATYNGADFLQAQLESLLKQTHQDFRLIARDDGSSDETLSILHRAAPRFGGRMAVIPSDSKPLGPAENFAVLMEVANADYIMFCDQDDIWHPDKVSRQLAAMQLLEEEHGADMPLLLHCDARVVDAKDNPLADSFQRMQRLKPQSVTLPRLLVQNVVLGCSVMMNRKLHRLASPMSPHARMHDSWAALLAASCGRLVYLDAPLLDYRQHGANAVGAQASPGRSKLSRGFVRSMMNANLAQAHDALERGRALMDAKTVRLFEAFLSLPGQSKPMRTSTIVSGGFLREPKHHNLLVLALY